MDKLKHFLAGFVICMVTFFVVALVTDKIQASLVGLFMAALAGLLKEFYDKFIKKTVFDFKDLLATCLGGVMGFVIIEVISIL